jgi:pimeloyl-ACP methyl ester carboxylesterase
VNILHIDSSTPGANSITRPLLSSQFASPTRVRGVAASFSAATLLATAPAQAAVKPWMVMDAPLPGFGHWDDQLKNPKVWHFNFRGPDVERLVAGRERILLDRFYNELSANPAGIDEQTRDHYAALYARPLAIHNAFSGQFAAFAEDAVDNQKLLADNGKLTIPVLAVGGDHSYGAKLATEIGFAATDVRAAVIKDSGHWIMEEQPGQAVALIVSFLGE